MLGLKNVHQKNFRPKKNLDQNEFGLWVHKKFGPKIFGSTEKFGSKKIFGRKIILNQKRIVGPTIFWVKKTFGLKKIVGP